MCLKVKDLPKPFFFLGVSTVSNSNNTQLVCSCCGAELTKPQFFNGRMYGYTCINKVAPKQKKSNIVMHMVALVSIKSINNTARMQVVFSVNGKKAAVVCYTDMSVYTQDDTASGNIKNITGKGFILNDGIAMITDDLLKQLK